MAEKDPKQAENKEALENNENNTEEGGDPSKPPIWKRFLPVIIVAGIVIFECITASFLVPSGNAALAAEDLTPDKLRILQEAGIFQKEQPPEEIACVEFDMGEYNITHSTQSAGATTHVSFHLYGVVQEDQAEEFKALFDEHENRIRDLVRSIVRETDISELSDPGLGLIKSQISEKVNRRLGKQILESVVFGSYTFMER